MCCSDANQLYLCSWGRAEGEHVLFETFLISCCFSVSWLEVMGQCLQSFVY